MSFELVAIDLGKLSFHLHGVDCDGAVLSRKVTRSKLLTAVCELAPTRVAMEACPGAHHWGRLFQDAGIRVVLIHPRFLRPFVRGAKNDAVDAEAIFEAASRPTMRFVPVKTPEQQDLQALHRIRERLVCQRTALINQPRGLLAEAHAAFWKGVGIPASGEVSGFSVNGPDAYDLSRMAHEAFDKAAGTEGTLPTRSDRFGPDVFARIRALLNALEIEQIKMLRHKFVAHAADRRSHDEDGVERYDITLNQLEAAQKALVQSARRIELVLQDHRRTNYASPRPSHATAGAQTRAQRMTQDSTHHTAAQHASRNSM